MRIATRLVLALTAVVALVMVAYTMISLFQREAWLRDVLASETRTLARALRAPLESGLRATGVAGLERDIAGVLDESETLAALVVDGGGRTLAGRSALEQLCLAPLLAAPADAGEQVGWIECGGPVRWARIPLVAPASAFVLVQRATVMERELGDARARLLTLTLALLAAAAIVIFWVLRDVLATPLGEIMRGVRAFSREGGDVRVAVDPTAGELHELALAFNDMTAQLETKRRTLMLEVEERLALERRVHDAETLAVAGRLTGGLLHELGSPLAVITMQADAILSAPDAPPHLRERGQEIETEVGRIARLIDGLLRMARRHGLEFEPLDLRDVVRAALQDVEARCVAVGVRPELRLPRSAVLVRGHHTLLRHAVSNVLVNALHALARHDGERQIWIEVEREETYARIVVEDSGTGIAPEVLARIFEPFVTTKSPTGEGSGLGLTITRTILEEHHGMLRIEPRQRGGTLVVLAVPLDRRSSPARA